MLSKETLEGHLKDAIRAGDELQKRTLRQVLTEIKIKEVDIQDELDEATLFGILQKAVKAREETIEDARKADRPDIIASAEEEISVLQHYLPKALSESELDSLVRDTMEQLGASDPSDMGNVMKAIMPKIQGRADGKAVSSLVRELLSGS